MFDGSATLKMKEILLPRVESLFSQLWTPRIADATTNTVQVSTCSLTSLDYSHLPRDRHSALAAYQSKYMRPITREPSHAQNVEASVLHKNAEMRTLKDDEEVCGFCSDTIFSSEIVMSRGRKGEGNLHCL